jgi:TRAP-type uncharacterized transport system fused permease subunit
LLIGHWYEVALSVTTAIIGAILLGVGTVGYLFRPVGMIKRALFILSAGALLIPVVQHGAFAELTWAVNGSGIVLAILLASIEWFARQGSGAQATAAERAKAPSS